MMWRHLVVSAPALSNLDNAGALTTRCRHIINTQDTWFNEVCQTFYMYTTVCLDFVK